MSATPKKPKRRLAPFAEDSSTPRPPQVSQAQQEQKPRPSGEDAIIDSPERSPARQERRKRRIFFEDSSSEVTQRQAAPLRPLAGSKRSATAAAGAADDDDAGESKRARTTIDGDDAVADAGEAESPLPDYQDSEDDGEPTEDGVPPTFEQFHVKLLDVVPPDYQANLNTQLNNTETPIYSYVANVFENKKEDHVQCLAVLETLVIIHGAGDIWRNAGVIENYLFFDVDPDEDWSGQPTEEGIVPKLRFGPAYDPKWSELGREALKVAREVSSDHETDTRDRLKQLYFRAKKAALCNVDAIVEGANDFRQRHSAGGGGSNNVDRCLNELRTAVEDAEYEALGARWSAFGEKLAKLHSAYAEGIQKELGDRYDEKVRRDNPIEPVHDAWELAWSYTQRRVDSERPSSCLRGRYADLKKAVFDRQARAEDQRIFPPLWEEGQDLAAYIEALTAEMDYWKEVRQANIHSELQYRLRVARATGDIALQTTLKNALVDHKRLVREGVEPFNVSATIAGEVPDIPTAPPRTDILAKELGFDGDRVEIPGHWTFGATLGSGGYGHVASWIRKDENNQMTGRAAVKEAYLGPRPPEQTTDMWDIADYWFGNRDDRIPMEYELMRILEALPEKRNVLRCRAYAIYDVHKMFRLYLEYCHFGDLHSLWKKHIELKQRSGVWDYHIPIRVMWSIFDALTNALSLTQRGYIRAAATAPADWTGIIHSDIKPQNIFLKNPRRRQWIDIPTTVLGDFGLAGFENDAAINQKGRGTRGWRAPEMQSTAVADDDGEVNLVGRHSDIWVVGRVMKALMNLESGRLPDFKFSTETHGPEWLEGTKEYYESKEQGKELCTLVDLCVLKRPELRIRVAELSRRVRVAVRAMRRRDPPAEELLLCYPDEVYHGLAAESPPRPAASALT